MGPIKFTAGYLDWELNFCIENLSERKVEKIPLSILLTEKILLRGVPTKLSSFLKNKLEKYYSKEEITKNTHPYLIGNKRQIWTDKTILGNPDDLKDNPAVIFYQNLNKDLDEYGFVSNLIYPEFEITEFCPEIKKRKMLSKTIVDFFIPNAKLVIEIDGNQHENSILLDQARDKVLEEYEILTIRIKTQSIRNRDNDYFDKINLIKSRLSLSNSIKKYKISFENKSFEQESYSFTVTAICRFQILIIELLKLGTLKFQDREWKISVNSDVICDFNWVQIATEDIFEWLHPISIINDEKVILPKLKINYCKKDNHPNDYLPIDFKLFERVDEKKTNIVSVKSYYINKIMLDEKTFDFADYNESQSNDLKNIVIKNLDKKRDPLNKILYQLYGYQTFKEGQFYIIENILKQVNTLGLLPTGGGKSLCFQMPSILQLGCCIVVCPIKALMKDHVDELDFFGFKGRAEFISGDKTAKERNAIYDKIRSGKVQFIFISPERMQTEDFRNVLIELDNKTLISYLAIDEVHCLSEWGHDFRPSYLALANTVSSILKLDIPIISLTATASPNVLKNIISELNIEEENVIFRMQNSRPELNYEVQNTNDKNNYLLKNITEMKNLGSLSEKQAGIVFTMHVNGDLGCSKIEQDIKKYNKDITTGIYCGDKPNNWTEKEVNEKFDDYKIRIQNQYKNNETQLMCATKSFGMGINKPNIRFSIHYGIPSSMEALYQESGRTGRDGKTAKNIILFTDEKNKIPEEIFDPKTNLEDLYLYSTSGKRNEQGDFKNQLFLATNPRNNQTITKELENINNLLTKLENNNSKLIELFSEHEVNLYRLLQLGIVIDWQVKDFFRNIYLVSYGLITDKEIATNVLKQIKKYLRSAPEIEFHQNEIEEIIKSASINKREELIRYLLEWNNDNFLYMRRQSLKTLYDYTKEFKDTGAKEFKKKVENYFKVDGKARAIEQYMDKDYDVTPNHLKEILQKDDKLIPEDQVKELIFILARFLESYQNNPWLNLLSSMCRLINKSFDNPDGKVRLYNFITEAKKSSNNWKNTLEQLLDFAKTLNDEDKLTLSQVLQPHLDNYDELIMLHKYLQDDYSAIVYLDKFNKRLGKVI